MTNATTASSQQPSDAASATVAVTTAPAQTSNAGRKRRSCDLCSRRKVKCDKQKPCRNCVKYGGECVFPAGKAIQTGVAVAPELVAMLQRLEKVVQTLEPREPERPQANTTPLPTLPECDRDQDRPPTSAPRPTTGDATTGGGAEAPVQDEIICLEDHTHAPELSRECIAKAREDEDGGKIIVDAGRDTYVRRWFWDTHNAEISSVHTTDDEHSDVEESDGFLSTTPHTWRSRRPDLGHQLQFAGAIDHVRSVLNSQKLHLWNVFKERVEPLIKMIHLPSLEQEITVPATSLVPGVGNGARCILLSIQYGAVTSLSEEECNEIFQLTQTQVLRFMRDKLGQMFSKAMLIHTGNIQPLQALVLYIVFLRHHEPRLSWNLSGLAIRLAQNFGIHREGSLFRLSKFDIEMRRRLWWQIAVLDTPSAEDYSGEFSLLEMGSFDAQMPLNLNDTQLHPAMMEYPPETTGITDMTFTLARCQITSMYRCMIDSRRTCGTTGKTYEQLSFQERSDWIDSCESEFSQNFLRDYSPTIATHWMTVILTRMLFHKVRLHGCNPLQDSASMSDIIRKRLFLVAVEVIELNYKLRTDPRTRPWIWLFSSYTQWHAFSLVLVWLQKDPLCKGSRRAWEAVEKAIVLRWEHPLSLLGGRKPQQWRSIIKQVGIARSVRKSALGKRKRGAFHSTGAPSGTIPAVERHTDHQSTFENISRPFQQQRQQQQQSQSSYEVLKQSIGSRDPPVSAAKEAYMSPETIKSGLEYQQTQNSNPGFLYGNMPDMMASSDPMMMDEEFSTDEFQNVPDFLLLQNFFQGVG